MLLLKTAFITSFAAALPILVPRSASFHLNLSLSANIVDGQCTGSIMVDSNGNGNIGCTNIKPAAACYSLQNNSPYGGSVCALYMYDQLNCLGEMTSTTPTGPGLGSSGTVDEISSYSCTQ